MPHTGVIKGGRLDGWRYAFICFMFNSAGALVVKASVTPPDWPFPAHVKMVPRVHFRQLRAIVGERAKCHNAAPLIQAAIYFQQQEQA